MPIGFNCPSRPRIPQRLIIFFGVSRTLFWTLYLVDLFFFGPVRPTTRALLVFCYAISLTRLFLCVLGSIGSRPLIPSTIHSFLRFISSLYHSILL